MAGNARFLAPSVNNKQTTNKQIKQKQTNHVGKQQLHASNVLQAITAAKHVIAHPVGMSIKKKSRVPNRHEMQHDISKI